MLSDNVHRVNLSFKLAIRVLLLRIICEKNIFKIQPGKATYGWTRELIIISCAESSCVPCDIHLQASVMNLAHDTFYCFADHLR